MGGRQFTQGDQFKGNGDGTYTVHAPGRDEKGRLKNDGSYSESTRDHGKEVATKTHQPDGKGGFADITEDKRTNSKTEHVEDRDGNYTDTNYKDGKKTGDTVHKKNPDGSVSDVDHDADGKPTRNRDTQPDGSFKEQKETPEGRTDREQDKDGNYTDTYYDKEGNKKGDTVHKKNPDGSVSDVDHDAGGAETRSRKTQPDGSFNEHRVNADQTKTERDQDKNGNFTETKTSKDGKEMSGTFRDKEGNGYDVYYDSDGRTPIGTTTRKNLGNGQYDYVYLDGSGKETSRNTRNS
ncbi:MAG: hypothetical protein HC888_13485 [Candidatus Competibacteraceae bacterium]|nr:hypothetical protein [Candidatus Competibacteraceae bacterium]